jgi:hypothetical protein
MDRKKLLLENFVVDNEDLEHLESLLDQFNIFEAVGMVHQEIRHSNFLSFLLNPSASHKLGDIFLKAFLRQLLTEVDNAPLSTAEIAIADLNDIQVRREWKFIDVLFFSPSNKIVCAIENKVYSQEHSNQLQRYREIILKEFQGFKHIFVYLTPTGISPYGDEDQQYWLTYSYHQVTGLIDDLCSLHRSSVGSEVFTLMQHYSTLIKRHLMENSEVAQLCQEIYWKHKEALDLIFEHRPNLESDVFELLKSTIKNTASNLVVLDHAWSSSKILGFAGLSWDTLSFQKTCKDWTASKRILIFEFKVEPPKVNLYLTLGPGELATRVMVFEAIESSDLPGFTNKKPTGEKGWISLIKRTVSENVKPEGSSSEVSEEIHEFWQGFLKNELPRVTEALTEKFLPFNQT